jgi:hypothetical protein
MLSVPVYSFCMYWQEVGEKSACVGAGQGVITLFRAALGLLAPAHCDLTSHKKG